MTNRDELVSRLKQASVKGSLRSVLDEAVERIGKSAACEIHANETKQSAAHYAFIYQRRANNPNPAVKAIPGLLESLENFKNEAGNLEMVACSLDQGSVAVWFSESGQIVGCMLLGD